MSDKIVKAESQISRFLKPYEDLSWLVRLRHFYGIAKIPFRLVRKVFRKIAVVLRDSFRLAVLGSSILTLRVTMPTDRNGRSLWIVDPFSEGHHAMYLGIFADHLVARGYKVTVLTASPQEVLPFLRGAAGKVELVPWIPKLSLRFESFKLNALWKPLEQWLNTGYSIRLAVRNGATAPSRLLITWLDSFLGSSINSFWVDSFLAIPWAGVYFHPRSYRRKGESRKEALLASKHCYGVLVLDEGIISQIKSEFKETAISWVPDFTVAEVVERHQRSNVAIEVLRRANGRKVMALVGSIEPRKGAELFWETVAFDESGEFFYVMAGHIYRHLFSNSAINKLQHLSTSASDRFMMIDRRLSTEEEFNSIVEVSDVLFACYVDFPHSSNLLSKAAAYNVPILVTNKDLMGERVMRWHLGACLETIEPQSVQSLMRKLSHQEEAEFGFRQYREEHSETALVRCLDEIHLVSVLGSTAEPIS